MSVLPGKYIKPTLCKVARNRPGLGLCIRCSEGFIIYPWSAGENPGVSRGFQLPFRWREKEVVAVKNTSGVARPPASGGGQPGCFPFFNASSNGQATAGPPEVQYLIVISPRFACSHILFTIREKNGFLSSYQLGFFTSFFFLLFGYKGIPCGIPTVPHLSVSNPNTFNGIFFPKALQMLQFVLSFVAIDFFLSFNFVSFPSSDTPFILG